MNKPEFYTGIAALAIGLAYPRLDVPDPVALALGLVAFSFGAYTLYAVINRKEK